MAVRGQVTSEDMEKNLEQQAAQAERTVLQQLQAGPYTEITVPDDTQNPNDKVVVVGINGVPFTIPRGIPTMVPQEVANVWRDSYIRTREAQERIDRSTSEKIELGY